MKARPKRLTPSELSAAIDELYQARNERLELKRRLEELKAEEESKKGRVLELLARFRLGGARGAVAQVSRQVKTYPNVQDWDALYEHIRRTKDFSLLQRRIGVEAWRERVEAGKLPPGTEVEDVTELTLTKIRRRKAS